MFSPDCRFLRIGAQLFKLDDQGDYISIPGLNAENEAHPPYIEEFTSSSNWPFIVFATRRNITKNTQTNGIEDGKHDSLGGGKKGKNKAIIASDQDDQDGSADNESDSSYASSTDSNDRAYETWSECSTEHEDEFEDDIIGPWMGAADIQEDGFSDSSESSDGEIKEDSSDDDKSSKPGSDSSSEDDLPTSAVIGYGRWYSDDEDNDKDGEGEVILPTRPRRGSRDSQGTLTIVDTSDPVPKKIFRFSYTVLFMLYASPPVLHPSKSLVVWPLGGGDVLFADFMKNTYFIRKLRPSTSHSECRHILCLSVLTLV